MRAELNCMMERFPELKEEILSLFNHSDEFKTLCHDYFLCVKSLNQLEYNISKDEEFVHEYMELKKGLESEMFKYINDDKNHVP